MPTLYDLKPAFQARLRPLTQALAKAGVTANQVTISAALISIAAGSAIGWWSSNSLIFLLLPPVLFIRMALNAIDGILAREHGQASRLGLVLNEVCDVVSDLALILPFATIFPAWGVMAFALAAFLTEFVGLLGLPLGSTRRYDGPFGKSDRAFGLGLLAVLLAIGIPLGAAAPFIFPALALLSLLTALNRARAALADKG